MIRWPELANDVEKSGRSLATRVDDERNVVGSITHAGGGRELGKSRKKLR